jgi:hypothetical protein
MHRSLSTPLTLSSPAQDQLYKHNPFTPLSAQTELERMHSQLSLALDRWDAKFQSSVSPDIRTLYHYARLYLSCPAIASLTQLASVSVAGQASDAWMEIDISEESVSQAWELLDVAATCPKVDQALCPAWMPVVVFHAALVVWAKIRLGKVAERGKDSSVRALLAFKVELETMYWPCCGDMVMILQRLMAN